MIRKILSLLLTFLVVVSTTGIVVASHTCMAGTERNISLFQESNCCGEENTPCHKTDSRQDHVVARCCVTEYTYVRNGATTVAPEQDLKIVPVFTPSFILAFSEPAAAVVSIPIQSHTWTPLSGKPLLHAIHRLLI